MEAQPRDGDDDPLPSDDLNATRSAEKGVRASPKKGRKVNIDATLVLPLETHFKTPEYDRIPSSIR